MRGERSEPKYTIICPTNQVCNERAIALAETATVGSGNASGLSRYSCGEPLLRGERGAAAASGLAVSDEGARGKPPPPDPRHRLYTLRKGKRKEYDIKI